MRPERQRTQSRHLPQQRAHVRRIRVAILDRPQIILGERGLEAYAESLFIHTAHHPYSKKNTHSYTQVKIVCTIHTQHTKRGITWILNP